MTVCSRQRPGRIAENACEEGSVVIEHIRTGVAKRRTNGYDVRNNMYTDPLKAGIIYPAKVTHATLEIVASVAALVLNRRRFSWRSRSPCPPSRAGANEPLTPFSRSSGEPYNVGTRHGEVRKPRERDHSMWDAFVTDALKNARRYPRLSHQESINLRMTRSFYDRLNASPDFRAAFKDFLALSSVDDSVATALAVRWEIPSQRAPRDLAWSRAEHAAGQNTRALLLAAPRRYPGLEDDEEDDAAAWTLKGYELTPPRLGSPASRAQSAYYLLLHRRGLSYQKIAAIAKRSVSSVFGAVQVWRNRLYGPPPGANPP